ncbi:MAG: hypothetical protein U0L59_08480 [Faecalimonas sp.]|nr:hypothetical protein [Faecalimonas sp.]
MKFFVDEFKEIKKASEPLYKSPKSVQETMEIIAVSEDGIFQTGPDRYDKGWLISNVNYATASDEVQEAIAIGYCKFVNSMDCEFKITANNKNKNWQELEKQVFASLDTKEDEKYRRSYNEIIEEKVRLGTHGIEQELYLTVTVQRKSYEEAKAHFATIEANITKRFTEMGSRLTALSGNERLQILYDYYHLGNEEGFKFNLKEYKKSGQDFKNDLCNGAVKYYPDYYEEDGKFCRVLYVKTFASSASDRCFVDLSTLPIHSMLTKDCVPVSKEITMKIMNKKYLGIESDIVKQQRVRNRNNDFASDISYMKRAEKKEIESMMDDVRENDQCLFLTSITMVIMADSKEELNSHTETVKTIAKGHGCTMDVLYFRQREGLNTTLPIGVRQVETMRTLFTNALVAFLPFNVQELNMKSGFCYGINQISKNLNIVDRKKLPNGNGFVFGNSGSGKSVMSKWEIMEVKQKTNDRIIVAEPTDEYLPIAKELNGTIIKMSTFTDNHVNPLDIDVDSLDVDDSNGLIRMKAEFMFALCEQCYGEKLNRRQESIIDRCVRDLFFGIARSEEKHVPIMSEFYELLKQCPEKEAKDLVLALDIFVNGSLNIFNHHTNVDMDNRFTVFAIRELGEKLAPVCMLVMMETIQQKIIENGQNGFATWLYIDEFHMLLNSEYTAKYLQQLWKKVRKQGGLCTGITQNIMDLLESVTATTMLANSEFVIALNQSNPDAVRIEETLGISKTQLRFVSNSPIGTGLLKCGAVVVPFDNQIGKDTEIYKLVNTNIYEKFEEAKK